MGRALALLTLVALIALALVTVSNSLQSNARKRLGPVTVDGGTLHMDIRQVTTHGEKITPMTVLVPTFEIGRFEVTWKQWQEVRAWAVTNGYKDLYQGAASGKIIRRWLGAGEQTPDDSPVCYVDFYSVVKWCNAKSEMEGLTPVYRVNGEVYRNDMRVPDLTSSANGYRLPTETEWEWAARGGVSSQGYTYSGSNDVNAVAWYDKNSLYRGSSGAMAVGTKAANELGIYDMSGNVWEWCHKDVALHGHDNRLRGGSFIATSDRCAVNYRSFYGEFSYDIGFRVARNAQ